MSSLTAILHNMCEMKIVLYASRTDKLTKSHEALRLAQLPMMLALIPHCKIRVGTEAVQEKSSLQHQDPNSIPR